MLILLLLLLLLQYRFNMFHYQIQLMNLLFFHFKIITYCNPDIPYAKINRS